MPPDPITAVLDQLAAHHEQIARLDRTVEDLLETMAQLVDAPPADQDAADHLANPVPKWWKLPAEHRREPLARLRAWVEQVYRPGYGHLAATLGPCWEAHDLCLYGLDILAELWSVLYLQDHSTRHDVATPDMIRQLPSGHALVIRGGYAPVIARLPRAWKNPAYRRVRHEQPILPSVFPPAVPMIAELPPEPDIPDHVPPTWIPDDGTSFPWS